MGLFDLLFRKNRPRLFHLQPADARMLHAQQAARIAPSCTCLAPQGGRFAELQFHSELQDTECDAWKWLESLIEKAAADGAREFAPGLQMPPEHWQQIVTLPASIGRLQSVKKIYLYGSHLVRVPVEIGKLKNLEEFDAYTSYRLHWLPYEITRCPKLARSRMSTRALYGNYKYRPPFPRLGAESAPAQPGTPRPPAATHCSVCKVRLPESIPHQVWISLRVATDVMPLLVNVCSKACIQRLPRPAKGYVDHPHCGGLAVQQPPRNR